MEKSGTKGGGGPGWQPWCCGRLVAAPEGGRPSTAGVIAVTLQLCRDPAPDHGITAGSLPHTATSPNPPNPPESATAHIQFSSVPRETPNPTGEYPKGRAHTLLSAAVL
ncbi:hypothetical protein GCM10027570_25840 [Streptomonospora sediminis]